MDEVILMSQVDEVILMSQVDEVILMSSQVAAAKGACSVTEKITGVPAILQDHQRQHVLGTS